MRCSTSQAEIGAEINFYSMPRGKLFPLPLFISNINMNIYALVPSFMAKTLMEVITTLSICSEA